MKRLIQLSAMLLLAACGSPSQNTSELAASHSRSNDVQITGAAGWDMICFLDKDSRDSCSGLDIIKPERQCEEINRRETTRYVDVDFDCTLAIAGKYGAPLMRKVTVSGSKSKVSSDRRMHFRGLMNVKRVYGVVKKAAYDADSFKGIGFFANEISYKPWNEPPAPRGADRGWFTHKDGLKITGSTTLKNGEKALQAEFILPITGATAGSSYVKAAYFRPYAKFEANGEEYLNWDNVADDYFANTRTEFDRSRDVLQ